MSVFFIKDGKIEEWLKNEFNHNNFPISFQGINYNINRVYKYRLHRIFVLHYYYIKQSFTVLFISKKNDILICWLDVTALYFFLLSIIFLKKREIIPLNIMFNEGDGFITETKKKLFQIMLRNHRIHPTVTSSELANRYKQIFNLHQKVFYLLHDCYGNLEIIKKVHGSENNYVFCGGKNARDWGTIVKAADLLPNIKFVVVGSNKNTIEMTNPPNVYYYYNIPFSEFQDMIGKCSILALPLNTEAPAGLIVLFSAGLMAKPVITTDNVTMREYITSGENGILVKKGDYKGFANEIDKLMKQPAKQKEFGEKLQIRVEELGSPKVYVNELIKIVNTIQKSINKL